MLAIGHQGLERDKEAYDMAEPVAQARDAVDVMVAESPSWVSLWFSLSFCA
jgi:hypothetical protein